jgi:hypothetical protein
MTAQKKPVLDIFEVLNHINSKDFQFIENQSEEKQRGFQPYLIQRWLYSSTASYQVMALNEYCNMFLNSPLNNHPNLLYKLMTVTATNKQRYTYIKPKQKKCIKGSYLKIVANYYQVSTRIAEQYMSLLTLDDVKELGRLLGMQQAELKNL